MHPISATYAGNWAVTDSTLNFFLTAVHNIPGGKHGTSAYFEQMRVGAIDNYTLFRFGGTAAHVFSKDWQLRFVLNGQVTSDALVPAEQFGAGGAGTVRGFLEREVINDNGYTTNLELYTPNLLSGNAQGRLLAFYDTGHLTRNNAQPGEETKQSMGSVGIGVRLTKVPHWALLADLAHVVDGSDLTPKGTNRAEFKVVMTF